MANTYNASAMTEYVNVHKDELFVKSTVGAKSLKYVEKMYDVKHKEQLNYLDSTVVLADGSACGWNPQGTDTFGEKFIEVHPISVQKEFCGKDFRKSFANYQLEWESGRISVPFEQKIAESNMNAIQDAVEKMIWQGDATVGVTGWLADIANESLATKLTADSGDTIVTVIDKLVAGLPIAMLNRGRVNLFVSYTTFRAYVQLKNAYCCANQPIIDANTEELAYAGDSRIVIVPVMGLEGASIKAVAANEDSLVYGTDIEGADNKYRWFRDDKESKDLFDVLFVAGTAVKFGDMVATIA